MSVFVIVGGIVAAYFIVAAIRRPRHANILAAGLWFAFAIYEYLIANGTLCDANCNIRVDLGLILPILGFASYLALQATRRPVAIAALYAVCFAMAAFLAALLGYQIGAVVAGAGAFVSVIYAMSKTVALYRSKSLRS